MEDSGAVRKLAVSVVAQALADMSHVERDGDKAKEAAAWLYLDAVAWLEMFGIGADIEHEQLEHGIREFITGGVKHPVVSVSRFCGVER